MYFCLLLWDLLVYTGEYTCGLAHRPAWGRFIENLHTCEHENKCLILLATEIGVVVTQQKQTETYSYIHIQKFQAESGPGFSYSGISATGSFCGSLWHIFSKLLMSHLEKMAGNQGPIFWPSWHLAHSQAQSWFSSSFWCTKGWAGCSLWWEKHCQKSQQATTWAQTLKATGSVVPSVKWTWWWHRIISDHMQQTKG